VGSPVDVWRDRGSKTRSWSAHGAIVSIALFLRLGLLLLAGSPTNAQAHDPGLSSATVTVGHQQIEVLLGFARKDAETLLGFNAGADQRNQSELTSVVAAGTKIFYRQEEARPTEVFARWKDDQNLEIFFRYNRNGAARVRFASILFPKLPLGHREFLSIQTTDGLRLGETMLSSKAAFFEADLPADAAWPISTFQSTFLAFLRLGIEHILTGYDHLLFLFGLMVVCRDLRAIFKVITCFTVAHSITLALAALDIFRLPGRVVEPMIAASIAYVGIENLLRGDSPKRRSLVAFSFGLVHGLGFADGLRGLGINSGQLGILGPLLGFNLGVEIGQLSVAAFALPLLWKLRRNPVFVRRWIPICSGAVALAGSYWMLERILQS
jgi:hydrogenase/urease accessory protein HupE